MQQFVIKLKKGLWLVNVPIAIEVVASDLETKWKGVVNIGAQRATGNLKTGLYWVQANLPSGHKITRKCNLQEGENKTVELKMISGSPRESLEWVTISKPEALVTLSHRESQLKSIWLRLWVREANGSWRVSPWPVQRADREKGLVQYCFRFLSE